MIRHHARNPGRAFVRGRPAVLDRQHSWHFTTREVVPVVTRELAETHAREAARRGEDEGAALARILPLVGQPIDVLFR